MSTGKPKFQGVRTTTPVGRASFPNIFVPREKYYPPGTKPADPEKEYSIDVLFDKKADLKKFQADCDKALAEVYGTDKAKWPKNISYPLADQEILLDKAQEKGYSSDHLTAGAMYARFKTKAKGGAPKIVGPDMNDIIDPSTIYGGCYVKVSANLKVNEIRGKDPVTKKETVTVYVTPYLQGVQFVKDGDSFGGGRPSAESMFEPVSQDDESSLLGE